MGRYKLNSRLSLDIDLDVRTLTHDDIIALVRELVRLPNILGISEELDEDLKDYAAEALSAARARPSRSTWTSTSTSATAVCARSAS